MCIVLDIFFTATRVNAIKEIYALKQMLKSVFRKLINFSDQLKQATSQHRFNDVKILNFNIAAKNVNAAKEPLAMQFSHWLKGRLRT